MPAYLDNAATTRVCAQAAEAVCLAMTEEYGNPSSLHESGRTAGDRLKEHRAGISAALGCEPGELFFTSGGTEGDNWALTIAAQAGRRAGRHIVTSAVEHPAVLEKARAMEAQGFEVTRLKPDRAGRIDAGELERALRPDTILVSLMLVNNETGVVQPVKEAAGAIRRAGCPALLHTDAVQAFLKVPFSPRELGADLVTVSAHKVRGPKGVGALFIRKGLDAAPLLFGGGQEKGLRPGTEPTALIAGFAAACRAWQENAREYTTRMEQIKQYAIEILTAAIPELVVVSPGDAPHICALSLPGYPGEMLVRGLSDMGVYVSTGSACGRGKPSHVFTAMGLPGRVLMGMLRVSFSPENTREDTELLLRGLLEIRARRIAMR